MLNFKKLFASLILLGLATVAFAMTFQPLTVPTASDAGIVALYSNSEAILVKNKQVSSVAKLMSSTVRIHVLV